MSRATFLMALVAVMSAMAGAGTMYLNFDGDDGTGSSLPAGVLFGTDGGGENVFVNDQLEMGGGAWLDFGSFLGASFTAEFTIQNFDTLVEAMGASDGIFAFQTREEGCFYPGGLFTNAPAYPGVASIGFSESCALAGLHNADWAIAVPENPGSLATVKLVVDHGEGTVDVYVAFGEDATTPARRATNLIHAAHYPWGTWWSTEAAHLWLMNWLGTVVIDDVIIEGENVPDAGPPAPEGPDNGNGDNGDLEPPSPDMPISGVAGLTALGLAVAGLAAARLRRRSRA